jgi:cell division protein FtsI/penicillin-binding protein 2
MNFSRRAAIIAAVIILLAIAGVAGFRFAGARREARQRAAAEKALVNAAALLTAGDAAGAEKLAAEIDPARVHPGRLRMFRQNLAERKGGRFVFVRDRQGNPLAAYSFSTRDVVPLRADTAALIDASGGPLTIEAHLADIGTTSSIETTIDPAVQRAAADALAGYRGSLVAIDVATNEILAVANSAGAGTVTNLAFENGYEPGSVVKVLTMLNAFDSAVDVPSRYPLRCDGYLTVGGRQFLDWAVHGTVVDVNEAMAVSCNVAFGELGLTLGADRLREHMASSGFNASADLGLFTVPLGRNVGELLDPHAIASYAVGLERETSSPLHIAMLAAAIANGGTLTTPRFVRGRHTVLGEQVWTAPAAQSTRIGSEDAVRRAAAAMLAVVNNQRGTGRRAQIEGLTIAMKTGTAGDAAGGYDSVIMAYAPADRPRIAIGMIAENAGPAEFAGARIAQEFFGALRGRL